LKIITILEDKYNNFNFNLKFNLNSRNSQGMKKDDLLLNKKYNGGPIAGIVLYLSNEHNEISKILKILVSLFKEEAQIGEMKIDIPYHLSILAYNIRINNLICYAQGDRILKLNRQISDEEAKTKQNKPLIDEYKIPLWIKNMKKECTDPTKDKDEINEKTYRYTGEKICDIELLDDCIDKYICYLTTTPRSMISPLEI